MTEAELLLLAEHAQVDHAYLEALQVVIAPPRQGMKRKLERE